jgi:hypothetical protein
MIGPMPEHWVYPLGSKSTHHQTHKALGTRRVRGITWCCRVAVCPKSAPLAGGLRASGQRTGCGRTGEAEDVWENKGMHRQTTFVLDDKRSEQSGSRSASSSARPGRCKVKT